MSKNDDKTMVPDITFNSSGNDLSIDDIVKSTTSRGSESNTSSNKPQSIDELFDNTPSTQDTSTQVDEYVQPDNNKQYSLDEIQDVETNDDIRKQIEDEVNNGVEVEKETSENVTDDNYDVQIYSAALDLIREQGILNIPENIEEVDQHTLDQLIQYDQQVRNQHALEYVRNRTQDPRLQELFDHVMHGGTYEEAIAIKEVIDDQYNYAALNPSDEEHQRFLMDHYLREGLDPNNPIDARRLAKVPQEIESYISNMEGESMALEAQQYFIDKLEYVKQAERQQVLERERQRQEQALFNKQQEQNWINTFKQGLNQRPWSQDKKQKVIEQFNIVQLDNGEEVELWKYKWNKIWEDPALTHVFMDFLSDLDPYNLEFQSKDKTVDKQATSKIMELINRKNNSENRFKSGSRHYSRKPHNLDSKPKIIDPTADF
jgi:hypothetical protein